MDRFSEARARLRRGELRGSELLGWLAADEPPARDAALEALLGVAAPEHGGASPGPELIGYIPSGVAPIVRAVLDVPVVPDDVFVDVGAGLGKVAMTVHLLSGARAIGVELDAALARRAQARADELGLADVSFVAGDARAADLADGTVFYLYLPCTGSALASVMERLRAVAERRAIVVCALGLDLGAFDWLTPRATDAFWLSIYDGRCPGAQDRVRRAVTMDLRAAEAVAGERAQATRPPPR